MNYRLQFRKGGQVRLSSPHVKEDQNSTTMTAASSSLVHPLWSGIETVVLPGLRHVEFAFVNIHKLF
jgi:hypothetical protein